MFLIFVTVFIGAVFVALFYTRFRLEAQVRELVFWLAAIC
jgi:hypothetical protein